MIVQWVDLLMKLSDYWMHSSLLKSMEKYVQLIGKLAKRQSNQIQVPVKSFSLKQHKILSS
ncbi:unnamed protein product [Trichobilharzia regenti]|nr:unnamed protein product [Trichobilharzia regenti]